MSIRQSQLEWRKSSFSGGNGGDCVEIADLPGGGRAVRDSKLGDTSPILHFTPTEWTAFIAGVHAGEFDS
ncbi:MAG: DUF397 domain-containing protein [Pseudonocardia sp.]|nr:DUF397 domain-containing protein [Pseudonocardia sp.]